MEKSEVENESYRKLTIFSKIPYALRLNIISMISFLVEYKIEVSSGRKTFFLKSRNGGFSSINTVKLVRRFFGRFREDQFRKIYFVYPSIIISGQVWGKFNLELGDYIPHSLKHLKVSSSYQCSIQDIPRSIESLTFLYGGFLEMDKTFLERPYPFLTKFKFMYQHDSHEIKFNKKVLDNLSKISNVYLYYANMEDLIYLLNHPNGSIKKIEFALRKSRESMLEFLELVKPNHILREMYIFNCFKLNDKHIEFICKKFPNLRILSLGSRIDCSNLINIPHRLKKLEKLFVNSISIEKVDCSSPFSQTFCFENPTFSPSSILEIKTKFEFSEVSPSPFIFTEEFRDVVGDMINTSEKCLSKSKTFTDRTLFFNRFCEYFRNISILDVHHLGVDRIVLVNQHLSHLVKLSTLILQEEELMELSKNRTIQTLNLVLCNLATIEKIWISEELRYLEIELYRNTFNNQINENSLKDLAESCGHLKSVSFRRGKFECLTTKVAEIFEEHVKNPNTNFGCLLLSNNVVFSEMMDSMK